MIWRKTLDNGLWNPLFVCTDPNGEELLLDGRSRVAACELAGVKPKYVSYEGNDPVGFVMSQNVHRRHLNESQLAMVAADLANLKLGHNQYKPKGSSADPPMSQAQAAAMVGTSVPSVKRAAKVLKNGTPELIEDVRSGKTTVTRAGRILRDREAEQRRIAEVAAKPAKTTIDIRLGDYQDALCDLAPNSVPAIITDVPYLKTFLPELANLAVWADKVLDPDGVLAVMVGNVFLPEVFGLLDGYRRYRALIPVIQTKHPFLHQSRVSSGWKPVVVYGGSAVFYDGPIHPGDSDEEAKSHHKWGQDLDVFIELVERLTLPGQTVIDPFMGSGTTLLAAVSAGRHAIGCDIDPDSVAEAKRRLSVTLGASDPNGQPPKVRYDLFSAVRRSAV